MSARDLRYKICNFNNDKFLQGVLAKLSWNHNQVLLDKIKDSVHAKFLLSMRL